MKLIRSATVFNSKSKHNRQVVSRFGSYPWFISWSVSWPQRTNVFSWSRMGNVYYGKMNGI